MEMLKKWLSHIGLTVWNFLKLAAAYAVFALLLYFIYDFSQLDELTGIEVTYPNWVGLLFILMILRAVSGSGKSDSLEIKHKPYSGRSRT